MSFLSYFFSFAPEIYTLCVIHRLDDKVAMTQQAFITKCRQGQLSESLHLLSAQPGVLLGQDSDGCTGLFFAAERGHATVLITFFQNSLLFHLNLTVL